MAQNSTRWLTACRDSANALTNVGDFVPLVDLYRTPAGWLVKYDLAGVLPEDVKLAIDGSRLTLRGVRRDACVEQGCSQYRLEISYSRFERTVEFPESIEPAKVTLSHWHGFLLVRIDKR